MLDLSSLNLNPLNLNPVFFNPVFEFSRTHCIGICAFLVPANLLATLQMLIFVGLERPLKQIYAITSVATLYALMMVLHVGTWLMIGVVMVPTFVLLLLGSVCLALNGWAIAHPQRLTGLLQSLANWASRKWAQQKWA